MPRDPPLDPSGDEARSLLRRELLHPEYHEQNLFQQLLTWLDAPDRRAASTRRREAPPLSTFAAMLIFVLLVGALAWLLSRARRTARARAERARPVLDRRGRHRRRAAGPRRGGAGRGAHAEDAVVDGVPRAGACARSSAAGSTTPRAPPPTRSPRPGRGVPRTSGPRVDAARDALRRRPVRRPAGHPRAGRRRARARRRAGGRADDRDPRAAAPRPATGAARAPARCAGTARSLLIGLGLVAAVVVDRCWSAGGAGPRRRLDPDNAGPRRRAGGGPGARRRGRRRRRRPRRRRRSTTRRRRRRTRPWSSPRPSTSARAPSTGCSSTPATPHAGASSAPAPASPTRSALDRRALAASSRRRRRARPDCDDPLFDGLDPRGRLRPLVYPGRRLLRRRARRARLRAARRAAALRRRPGAHQRPGAARRQRRGRAAAARPGRPAGLVRPVARRPRRRRRRQPRDPAAPTGSARALARSRSRWSPLLLWRARRLGRARHRAAAGRGEGRRDHAQPRPALPPRRRPRPRRGRRCAAPPAPGAPSGCGSAATADDPTPWSARWPGAPAGPSDDVVALLGPRPRPPATDRDLITLASALAELDREVRRT